MKGFISTMLEFNFDKLLKNCSKCKNIIETDRKTLLNALYEPKEGGFISIVKTLSKNIPAEEVVRYFLRMEDITNIDFEKIKNNMETFPFYTCWHCDDTRQCNFSECIFYNLIQNCTTLAYKDGSKSKDEDYPAEKFPKLLQVYITQLSEAMVAPPQYIGTALLALFSALCSRFAYLKATPTWKIPLNGYYLIVGDVSTKKSPTINAVLELLNNHVATDDRIIANDSTIEALEQLLAKYKSILLYADEAGVMETLGGYTRTNQASTSKLLSLYTCKPYRVDRKGQKSVNIEAPKLSILAGIQPSILTKSQNLMRTGMLQRFIIAYAKRSNKYNGFSMQKVETEILQEMSNLVISLYEESQENNNVILRLSNEALKSLEFFQNEVLANEMDNTTNPALQDYYGKYKEHILKIAGIFHLIKKYTEDEKGNEISKETFDMALGVASYHENVSRELYEELDLDKPIDVEKGYKELMKKCQTNIFTPTYLNSGGIGGCDARKREYTNSFIDRLLEQNRCIELFNHGGKGRKFLLIRE